MRGLSVVFVCLLVALLISAYAAATLPATNPSPTPPALLSYLGSAAYGFNATVAPSAISNNTTVTLGHGTLFEALTRWVQVNLTYALDLSAPANITMVESCSVILTGQKWARVLAVEPTLSLSRNDSTSLAVTTTSSVNLTAVDGLISQIQNQTKYSAPAPAVVVAPVISGTMEVAGRSLLLSATPSFSLTLGQGIWNYSSPDLFSNGALNGTAAAPSGPGPQAYALVATGLVLAAAAGIAWLWYRSERTDSPAHIRERVRSMTRPYAEAIARTSTPPSRDNITMMQDWDDLVRVADFLGKPILRYDYQNGTDSRFLFYVRDASFQYVYYVREDSPPEPSAASPSRWDPSEGRER